MLLFWVSLLPVEFGAWIKEVHSSLITRRSDRHKWIVLANFGNNVVAQEQLRRWFLKHNSNSNNQLGFDQRRSTSCPPEQGTEVVTQPGRHLMVETRRWDTRLLLLPHRFSVV
jgi:hypothetical protein